MNDNRQQDAPDLRCEDDLVTGRPGTGDKVIGSPPAWPSDCDDYIERPDVRALRSSIDQPPPVPNARPAVWPLVMADMVERDQVGRARYGTPLQPHNGRDALADAYAEALDLAVYLRQALYERDGQ
jgi:hypothetical protein